MKKNSFFLQMHMKKNSFFLQVHMKKNSFFCKRSGVFLAKNARVGIYPLAKPAFP